MSLKYPQIGLRARFMLLAVVLTVTSSSIWGGWLWQHEKKSLLERPSREAEMLVSTMAIPIINAIVYEELGIIHEGGLLDSFVAEIMATPQLEVRYAFVLNEDGRVLAHTRLTEYRKTYSDPLTLQILRAPSFQQFFSVVDGERISDFIMPLSIAGKSWGVLQVGISMEPAYRELAQLARQVIFFSCLFSAGALFIYWIIGTMLVRPIRNLTNSMEGVGKGHPILLANRTRHDEIGLLQKSFADMLERLNRSEIERNITIARMLENERILAIGRLVSGVAHEVNNPLAGIEGALYQIERKGGDPVQRYVGLVRQSIERIGRIVGQLSDLSRVGEIIPQVVDSDLFFDDVVMFSRMAIKDSGCRLLTDNRCPRTILFLDRDKIHQVALNLIINAADATTSGGTVRLLAELDGDCYVLQVQNTGDPIPDDIAAQIFTPFFTTKEAGHGSGMGLAVSRGIAEYHGGSLTYTHRDGRTAFTLSIPNALYRGTDHA
ncbi:MAG: HAMP domain-containing protein [Desulfuromonadales bacterium]|nr:HAMP domain-containing protein [Desulfuromonadales bacterium]